MRAVRTSAGFRIPSAQRSATGRRAILLLGTSLLVYTGLPSAALAQHECGPPPPGGGTVSCDPAGNPYPGGVNYDPLVQDLTVVLEPGVVVTGGVEMGSVVPGVDLSLQAGTNTQVSASAAGREGVDLAASTGSVVIDAAAVSTAGVRAEGIQAETVSGAITIGSDTVSTQGDGSDGILAETAGGAIVITSGSVTTAGNTILGQPSVIAAGAHGIEALSTIGSITIDSTSITTAGSNANGILAESTSGAIDIDSGTITAADGRGIDATSVTGDINIGSGSVTTVGGLFSDGIFAETESGDIVIDSGTVSVGDGVGLFVINESGDTTITSGEVTVTGSPGIAAYGDYYVGGDINVVSGSVETTGSFANGIDVESRGAVSVRSTSIVTGGDRSRGIEANSDAGGVTIDSGTIATSGLDSRGIQSNVYNEAGVVIESGTITTLGDNGDGIVVATFGDNSTGDFEITSTNVSTQGHRSIGIYAYHAGSGDIVVTSGTVTTEGDTQDVPYGGSHGIELHANSGSITVASTTIETGGAGAQGILTTTNSGAINITSGTVTTAGTGAVGISAETGPGATEPELPPTAIVIAAAPIAVPPDISITSGTVSTTGDGAHGIEAQTVDGDIYVESGSIDTGGDGAHGILAETYYGGVAIVSGTVATSGAGSTGIIGSTYGDIYTGATGVGITSASVTTAGDDSLGIFAGGGFAYVDSGTVVTSGDRSGGIVAVGGTSKYVGGPPVRVTSDSVMTTGAQSVGIRAVAQEYGSVIIDSGSVVTGGDGSGGIEAESKYGNLRVASDSVVTTGDDSDGIFVMTQQSPFSYAPGSSGGSRIESGTIHTSGDRSRGIAAYGATVYIDSGTVITEGADSAGIYAISSGFDFPIGGSVTAQVTSGSVTTTGDRSIGIRAVSLIWDISVVSTGIVTAGAESIGIDAQSSVGDVAIDSGSVVTSGPAAGGILARTSVGDNAGSDGVADIASVSVTTSGDYSRGIAAYGGSVVIESGTIATDGSGSAAIYARSFDNDAPEGSDFGTRITSGSVTTTGANSSGIVALSDYHGVIVTSTGTVATEGDDSRGIDVVAAGPAEIHSATVTTEGASSGGIRAESSGDVAVTSGWVTTHGDVSTGIHAQSNYADAEVTSTGTVATTGAASHGIFADGIVVTVTSNIVTTTGADSTGIFAHADGLGGGDGSDALPASMAAGGDLLAAALGPDGGVRVTSGSVTTTGPDSPGIEVDADTGDAEVISTGTVATSGVDSDGILANADAGAVSIDANAVTAAGAGSNAIDVTSATSTNVTIRGLVQSGQALALQANGGAASVSTVAGGTISGAIDLTDNADTLNNAGTFDAIGTSAFGGGADVFDNSGTTRSTGGAAVLAGLENFNNSGLVDLGDGAPGDRLTVGNFNGLAGSRLTVDVDFTAGVADVLVTGVATGATTINLNAIGSQLGFNAAGILVVDAAAGTGSGAFSLPGGNFSNGYVTSGLIFDAANFNFLLVNAPGQPIFETAVVVGMTLDVWHQSADAVETQLETARAPAAGTSVGNLMGGGRFGGWIHAFAGETEREAVQSFSSGGATTRFDVSYEQDFEGIQGGIDHQSGPAIFGVTGGFGQSDTRFETSPSTLELDSVNFGLYAALAAGNFYANLLAKVDWIDVETNPGPGLGARFDATSYGVRGVAGFRFDFGRVFFAEPSVSLSWVTSDVDDYTSGGATIRFDKATSLRAAAGLRVGAALPTPSGGVFSPFVGIRAIEELSGDNQNDFLLGSTLNLTQEGPGTHGEASAGITFRSAGVEAFVRGELDFGDDVEGRTVRAGVRLRF